MKKLILIFLSMLSLTVSAQRVDKPNEAYYVYCYLQLGNMQNQAQLTIGDDGNFYMLVDKDGNKISFPSKSNFLTYMAKRGWEYVECMNVSDWWFILRKKVLTDKEAYSKLTLMYKTGENKGKIREEKP